MNKRQKKKREKFLKTYAGWGKVTWAGMRKCDKEYRNYLRMCRFLKENEDDRNCSIWQF